MSEIADDGGGAKGGKKRAKKSSTRVDMTPMVDLAFLLLTFFVLTSTFAKPKAMSLVYPAKDIKKDAEKAKINNAITFLVSEDKVFYYIGEFYPNPNTKGKPPTEIIESNFGPQGVRKLLADKNSFVIRERQKLDGQLQRKEVNDSIYKVKLIEAKMNEKALSVLVKTDTKAKCKNFIDLIDELVINDVARIAPVDITVSEQKLMDEKIK